MKIFVLTINLFFFGSVYAQIFDGSITLSDSVRSDVFIWKSNSCYIGKKMVSDYSHLSDLSELEDGLYLVFIPTDKIDSTWCLNEDEFGLLSTWGKNISLFTPLDIDFIRFDGLYYFIRVDNSIVNLLWSRTQLDGKINGYIKTYHENNILASYLEVVDNTFQGYTLAFNELGDITRIGYYTINDKKKSIPAPALFTNNGFPLCTGNNWEKVIKSWSNR